MNLAILVPGCWPSGGCGKGRQEALGKVQNEAHIRKVQKGTQTSTKKPLPL